ncbi:DUF2787 domain-containing protein [Vibrio campbellii]|nr:DUF2787 domain-containing protein [Vibrio campbellii]
MPTNRKNHQTTSPLPFFQNNDVPITLELTHWLHNQLSQIPSSVSSIALTIESSVYRDTLSGPAPAEFQLFKVDNHWQIKVVAGYDYTIKSSDNFGVLLKLDLAVGLLYRHGFPTTPITDVKALSMFKTWQQSVTENILNNRYDEIHSTILKEQK